MRAIRAGLAVATLLGLAGIAAQYARWRWDRDTRRTVAILMDGRGPGPSLPTTYSEDELIGLPDPVARYFELTLRPSQPIIHSATLVQTGEFATSPGRWAPFTAREHVSVSPHGFQWDARIRMMPLLTAFVRDSYVAGTGSMQGSLDGLIPIVQREGTPEMAAASLLRYLAEAVWFPTALLPSAGVRWDPLDESTARATLSDGSITVSMDAHFADDGSISRVRALRYRDVKGGPPLLTAWIGQFHDYHSVAGMRVPGVSEVGWVVDGTWSPYWKGRNTHYEFNFATRPTEVP